MEKLLDIRAQIFEAKIAGKKREVKRLNKIASQICIDLGIE